MDPLIGQHQDIINQFDSELLKKALKFDRTPINGIPGFDAADLAIGDQQTLMRGDDRDDERNKKRKKKHQNGGEVKKQHV